VTEQEIRDWYDNHNDINTDQCSAWMAKEIAAQLARLNANLERKTDEGVK